MKKFIYLFALIAAIFISTEGYCEFTSLQELNRPERVIGISETRAALTALKRDLPNAQLAFLQDNEGYIAVQLGKIDAYASSRNVMEFAIAHGLNGVKLLPDSIGDPTYVAVGISRASKIKDLKAKINEFLSELRADGTLDDMYRRWVIDSDLNMPDIGSYEKSGAKIIIGTVGTIQPFSFYIGDKLTGYEIELGQRFAKWLGAEVEFKVYDYGGIIAAATVGNIDLIMANLNITQERAEKIDYSDVLYIEESTLMVKSDSSSAMSALSGKKIAVVTGTTHPEITLKFVPTAQLAYFDSIIDTFAALKAGKVDAICTGIPIAKFIMAEDDSFAFFGEQLTHVECSAIFAKTDTGRKLCDEFSEFFKSLWDNGTIQEIESIWLGKDDNKKTITDYSKLPAPNGTLRMAVDLSMMPFIYVKDNMIVGYDIDCAVRFCEAYGYGLEIMPMSFAAIIPAVLSGKCDFAMGGITRTDEREESVLFSYPNVRTGNSFVIRKPEIESAHSSIKEFDGKKIGVGTGSIHAEVVKEVLPSAEIFYFDGLANIVTALASGKIDAIVTDDSIAFELEHENPSLTHLEEYLKTFDNAFIFAKTPESNKLRNELDEFIRSLKSDGTLDKLRDIWTGNDESLKTLPDYENYPDTNGVLNIALDNESPPFTYVKDGRVVGYDVDIIVRFCKAKGYRPEFSEMDFSGVIPAVISGKCDLGIGAITITEERRESVNFSEPVYTGGSVLLIRKQDTGTEYADIESLARKRSEPEAQTNTQDTASFIDELKASFVRTFIREDRWKLFIEGIVNTMIITVLSIIFGTILGFVVYLACRKGNPVANFITRFFVWLIQGMPMVVLLMILYYIIFGQVDIAGIWVAVIAFSMTFGASFYAMLCSGVNALDKGQTEAAYALGFTDRRAFFTIILPQAAMHFMPAYKGEVTALVKATAIVGYIAVQDLTKMGDIVRSRTYEAFFPLIAVAVIYFVLAGVLNMIVDAVNNYMNPRMKKREDILKGIKSHD